MIIAQKRRGQRERLSLFMNSVAVGHLDREPAGGLSFTYDQSWLGDENPFPISRQLPLKEMPFTGKAVRNYFDNLLPDDPRIRERIASQASAAGTQSFDLLAALGRDCVGALQFYPESATPGPLKPAKGNPISVTEIAQMLRDLRINPLGINRDSEFRISLAGAQSKTALHRKNDQWMIPEGSTPTTHILKPAIGKNQDGPDFSLSVENEWLCLKILHAYGLNVAEAEIVDFEDIRVLAVERFDRQWSGNKLFRIPQEDLCQALGVGPENKYESDGGPGIRAILALLNESDRRDEDRKSFMKAQLIFWLIGAIDGHAKNFSLFNRRGGGFILTPLYDVMSADPHVNPKNLPKEKIKLAMALGDNRHYKINEILPRHWKQTAAKCKFPHIDELIEEVVRETDGAIKRASSLLPRGFTARISEPIFTAMRKRVKILKEA